MNTMQSLYSRICLCIILRSTVVMIAVLVVLAWSNLALCGEIHDAVQSGDLAKVETLVNSDPFLLSSTDKNGSTPLILAVKKGDKDMVELLLSHAANVNANGRVDPNDPMPLHYAAANGRKEVVELLLANHADINARDNNGDTPLHYAVANGRKDATESLLAYEADVNAKNKDSLTPLHYAARYGHKDAAELLLAHGADVKCGSQSGDTVLKLACLSGKVDLAIYLYEKGASINYKDSSTEGIESTAIMNHILGDYFLAQDNLDQARASYVKAREYYLKSVDKYKGEATKAAMKQFGLISLQTLAVIGGGGVNTSGNQLLSDRKTYAKAMAKHYEEMSGFIDKVLECCNKTPSKEDIHACVSDLAVPDKR